MAPKKAPIPVVKPESVVIIIALDFEEPLNFKGKEIDIPFRDIMQSYSYCKF